jgi:indolepyruvate ferredoxin oxidoreductase beta subunit
MVHQPRSTSEKDKRPGWRIAISGTGGQGVLTAARMLCDAFVELGHEVVSSQLHGMAQRGGSVQSSVMIDCGISPVMAPGSADYVLGLEPVETARAMDLMSSRTLVFMNTTPVIPYVLAQQTVLEEVEAKYPDVGQLTERIQAIAPNVCAFDATTPAAEAGSIRTLNMLMLGCLLGAGSLPYTADRFWDTAARSIPPALAEPNTNAFFRGVEVGRRFQLAEARS